MSENRKTRSKIDLVCGIVALLCVAAMFVPIGQERGHFDQYGQVLLRGEIPYFVVHVVDAPGGGEIGVYMLGGALVLLAAGLLLGWAVRSFKGRVPTGKLGLAASIVNLIASAFVTMLLLSGAFDGRPTLAVISAIDVLAILALVLAILQKRAAD